MANTSIIGYLKKHPNLLLIVQGENEKQIWFHGLNDVHNKSDFIEMKPHPVFYYYGNTITEQDLIKIFKTPSVSE